VVLLVDARFRSQALRKLWQSYKDEAVGAKTWMSPVRPSRSSRWGVVGGNREEVPFHPPDDRVTSAFCDTIRHPRSRMMSDAATAYAMAQWRRAGRWR
jgi:hypothetical protein